MARSRAASSTVAPVSRAAARCLVVPGSRTTEYLVMPPRGAPLVADERMWTRNLRAGAHVLGLRMMRPPIEGGNREYSVDGRPEGAVLAQQEIDIQAPVDTVCRVHTSVKRVDRLADRH